MSSRDAYYDALSKAYKIDASWLRSQPHVKQRQKPTPPDTPCGLYEVNTPLCTHHVQRPMTAYTHRDNHSQQEQQKQHQQQHLATPECVGQTLIRPRQRPRSALATHSLKQLYSQSHGSQLHDSQSSKLNNACLKEMTDRTLPLCVLRLKSGGSYSDNKAGLRSQSRPQSSSQSRPLSARGVSSRPQSGRPHTHANSRPSTSRLQSSSPSGRVDRGACLSMYLEDQPHTLNNVFPSAHRLNTPTLQHTNTHIDNDCGDVATMSRVLSVDVDVDEDEDEDTFITDVGNRFYIDDDDDDCYQQQPQQRQHRSDEYSDDYNYSYGASNTFEQATVAEALTSRFIPQQSTTHADMECAVSVEQVTRLEARVLGYPWYEAPMFKLQNHDYFNPNPKESHWNNAVQPGNPNVDLYRSAVHASSHKTGGSGVKKTQSYTQTHSHLRNNTNTRTHGLRHGVPSPRSNKLSSDERVSQMHTHRQPPPKFSRQLLLNNM